MFDNKPRRSYCRLCRGTYITFINERFDKNICPDCASLRRWASIQREIQNAREAWKNHMKIQKEREWYNGKCK